MVAATRRKFTVDEYHRLIDWGFFIEENVELIRGEIIRMSPKRTPYSVCNYLLLKILTILLGDRAIVRGQEPIFIPPNSEPEPDLVIAIATDDNYLSSHPTPSDLLLVVEISDSTLKYDRDKLPLYAEAGINNYWIFNLLEGHLEVYTQPFLDSKGKYAYRYKQIVLTDEIVNIPGFDNLTLDLAKVFPE